MIRMFWMAGLTALSGWMATQAARADSPATIIVMDGSGSMWGQIEGRPKLEIARETVKGVLSQIPAGQELGLLAYGHREKGNCSDIELVVPPAADSAGQIGAAVDTMRFLGKTPLSDAVRQAAEALRYGEEAATVVLVTDGLETCAADPCALGRELEAAGLNFTAHVIGFGLSEAEGAQVSCLANATGGHYFEADDAEALARALQQTVAAPEPLPEAPKVTRRYFPAAPLMAGIALSPTGATIEGADQTTLAPFDFAADGTAQQCAALCASDAACAAWRYEPPGSLFVEEARCFAYDAAAEMDYTAQSLDEGWASGVKDGVLMLVRPYIPNEPLPEASLEAADTIGAGQALAITWTGPAADLDTIEIGLPEDGERWSYAYVATGNPLTLGMPGEPGAYELRYKYRDQSVIARRPITVTATSVTMEAPDQAPAGSDIAITWTGPDADYDNIQIAELGSDSYVTYAYVRDNNPLRLTLPEVPGQYELRYKLADTEVIATRPLTVLPADAPASDTGAAPMDAAPVPVVIEAATGGLDLAIAWSATPVEGQDLPPEAWAMPESLTGPVTAEFLPGLYDVRGDAGDQVFAGRITVESGAENRFVIPVAPDLSPAGEDQGSATPSATDPVPLRIKGRYAGAFAAWQAFALDGQSELSLESGAPRPGVWETQLDPGAWLILGRHEGADGATYLAMVEVSPGMAPDLTLPQPRYGASPAPEGSALARICEGPEICFLREGGLQLALPPGWGMEEPYTLTTAAGAGAELATVLRPASASGADGPMIALNPRQWDAQLGPCTDLPAGRLCQTAVTEMQDLRALGIIRATLAVTGPAAPAAPSDSPAPSQSKTAPLLERLQGTALPLPDGLDLGALLAPNLTLED